MGDLFIIRLFRIYHFFLFPYFHILTPQNERSFLSDEVYKTIRALATAEKKVKGSRFIGRATPVRSRDEAELFVTLISKQYHDATHNCYAYRIGYGPAEYTRFYDDGEPSGTAGRPILQAMMSHDLTNVAVVVTRYFGGTKLGTGGLIRAYGSIAEEALDKAEIYTFYPVHTLKIFCTYQHVNTIKSLINKFSGEVIDSDYGDSISMTIRLHQYKSQQFTQCLLDQTSGQVVPERV
ncbi:YigZ family protein [candidate division KSB1 bacterium]|nr:YigZ family protein [candidate division KSB1 bacterium]